ncbi:hypothetical protein ABEB36_000478 [Hypothenemus hampei]|uniref:Uncharacterized protein n=1 Tax=Hypothenemus hampei TaxID=57062 RepID=A0ABD1FEK7_HYPHA
MIALPKQNRTHHHHYKHKDSGGYFERDEKLLIVLLALFAVLPLIFLLLKVCRKISGYTESQGTNGEANEATTIRASSQSMVTVDSGIYHILTKQDYANLAPPRYSVISNHPTPVTYETPPPYTSAMETDSFI